VAEGVYPSVPLVRLSQRLVFVQDSPADFDALLGTVGANVGGSNTDRGDLITNTGTEVQVSVEDLTDGAGGAQDCHGGSLG